MSYIDFVLKCADFVWYIYDINCRVRHAGTFFVVETRSPCVRCVPAKERAWLEKKTTSRYDTDFDAMLVYLTKHLSQRTNTKK